MNKFIRLFLVSSLLVFTSHLLAAELDPKDDPNNNQYSGMGSELSSSTIATGVDTGKCQACDAMALSRGMGQMGNTNPHATQTAPTVNTNPGADSTSSSGH